MTEEDFQDLKDRNRKAITYIISILSALVLFLTGAVIYLLLSQANETSRITAIVTHDLISQCALNGLLGTIPLAPKPFPAKRTVQVVISSRQFYRQLECPGQLPPPGKELKIAAQRYGLKIG